MKIRWGNIFGVLVVVGAAGLLWRHGEEVLGFFGSIASIGPHHNPDGRMKGLLALTVVAVAIGVLARRIIGSTRR